MERMHGIDAFLIYSESPTSPFATLKVTIYKPVDPRDVPDFEEIRDHVKTQMERFGGRSIRMRVVRVPFDLHHPIWIEDPHYSPDDHIYHTALPSPGDKAQLCEFLSDLMGRPLDPDRPLWEIWIIEGLEGGHIAVAIKVHHALADGKTVATLLARSHSKSRTGEPAPRRSGEPDRSEAEAVSVPGRFRLIGSAMIDLVTTYVDELPHFVREMRQTRRDLAEVEEEGLDGGVGEKEDEVEYTFPTAPHTILNEKKVSRYRDYRFETFSLSEFKALSKVFDCTINTLILAICGEALKRYLAAVDTAPSTSLVAAMPLGDRGMRWGPTRLHSAPPHNSVAVAVVPLHQDITDFRERVQAIRRSTRSAIDHVRRSEGLRFDNLLEFLPGTFIRWVFAMMERRRDKGANPFANVVISNVPGPRKPLLAVDGRLEMIELLSTGNIQDQGHLNITVWSYVDNLSFSFYTRKGALPSPEKLTGFVREVVEELRKEHLAHDRSDSSA